MVNSTKPPLMLIGEAYGTHEAKLNRGFVGPSGVELLRMLNDAGVITFTAADRDYLRGFYNYGDPAQVDLIWQLHPEVYRTNVFNLHPPGNDIETLCVDRKSGIAGWPALATSKYLDPRYFPELERLEEEITSARPNLVLALGNTPLWALCGVTKISKLRGTTRTATHLAAGTKVLPIYHPAAVCREWSLRPLTVIDLEKANREKEFPDVRRPRREIWIEPSLHDIREFRRCYIDGCRLLSVDIETSGTRVTCIGFAPSKSLALVVPFDDSRAKGGHYWASARDEIEAWKIVKDVLADVRVPKLFQNGAYDISFLWRSMGIRTFGAREDSMLLSHALQPELNKGLGFLGSWLTDEGPWKTERRIETTKKDN